MFYNGFPPLGNSDHVVVSVFIDFPTNSQWDAPFHRIAYDYSCADWDGLCDHLRGVPWEDVFKPGASAAASEFCECVQVGFDVYIQSVGYKQSIDTMEKEIDILDERRRNWVVELDYYEQAIHNITNSLNFNHKQQQLLQVKYMEKLNSDN